MIQTLFLTMTENVGKKSRRLVHEGGGMKLWMQI